MRYFINCLVYLCAGCFSTFAQAPHISGDVYVSIKTGLFKADITVSNLPSASNYAIRLNTGFNVQDFRDSTGKSLFYTDRTYDNNEYFNYWIPANDKKSRYLPKAFKISYIGAFPVYSDTTRRPEWGDWKGNIAFNGKTVRASEQSAWYPILYDISQDRTYNNVTYDIIIHADGAKSIYVTGQAPQYGKVARVTSNRAFPLVLFVGDFDFRKEKETYLVNTNLTTRQADVLDGWFARIKQYYQKKLGIPYGGAITLLSSTPISKKNDWAFVTYPTIAVINNKGGIATMLNNTNGELRDSSILSLFSHELAHYYFGTLLAPNSTLRWAFLEGITEYIALQAMRDNVGKFFYEKKINSYVANLQNNKSFVPLKNIKNSEEIGEAYRYQYIPLLLTALEQQIGRETIWRWLHQILVTPNPITDYSLFKNSLLQSGVAAKTVVDFETRYLSDSTGIETILNQYKMSNTNSATKVFITRYYYARSEEILLPGISRKPMAVYTPVMTVPSDKTELDKIVQKFYKTIDNRCPNDVKMCTSDFNTYETRQDAEESRSIWLKKREGKYDLKEIAIKDL